MKFSGDHPLIDAKDPESCVPGMNNRLISTFPKYLRISYIHVGCVLRQETAEAENIVIYYFKNTFIIYSINV